MAGYCSVLHALELAGVTGEYGRRLRAAVIGFGASGRGAVTALNAHGVSDMDVLTHRAVNAVASPIHSARMVHFEQDDGDPSRCHVLRDGSKMPLAAFLAGHDIVVNCVLQDTDAPLTFITADDLGSFAPGALIVDVYCDEGMGFSWARPTTFAEPMFTVGNNVRYYGVDHSPSHLWDSAAWEISEALLPHLRPVLDGPRSWEADDTIRRAIEIRDGVIQNPRILSFQHRSPGLSAPAAASLMTEQADAGPRPRRSISRPRPALPGLDVSQPDERLLVVVGGSRPSQAERNSARLGRRA